MPLPRNKKSAKIAINCSASHSPVGNAFWRQSHVALDSFFFLETAQPCPATLHPMVPSLNTRRIWLKTACCAMLSSLWKGLFRAEWNWAKVGQVYLTQSDRSSSSCGMFMSSLLREKKECCASLCPWHAPNAKYLWKQLSVLMYVFMKGCLTCFSVFDYLPVTQPLKLQSWTSLVLKNFRGMVMNRSEKQSSLL